MWKSPTLGVYQHPIASPAAAPITPGLLPITPDTPPTHHPHTTHTPPTHHPSPQDPIIPPSMPPPIIPPSMPPPSIPPPPIPPPMILPPSIPPPIIPPPMPPPSMPPPTRSNNRSCCGHDCQSRAHSTKASHRHRDLPDKSFQVRFVMPSHLCPRPAAACPPAY